MAVDDLLKAKKIPLLKFISKQEFLMDAEIEQIGKMMSEDGAELEEMLLRYMGRDKLLLIKGLFYGDRFNCIDLLEVQDQLDDDALNLLTREQMLDHHTLLLKKDGQNIALAMSDPQDKDAIKFIEQTTGLKVTDRYVCLSCDIRFILSQDRLIAAYLMGQDAIPDEDFHKISELLMDQTAEFEEVFLRYVNRTQLLQIKTLVNGNSYSNIDLIEIKDGINDEFVDRLDRDQMRRYRAIILYEKDKELAVAMDDPCDKKAVRAIEGITGGKVTTRYVTLYSDINQSISHLDERKKKTKQKIEKKMIEAEEEKKTKKLALKGDEDLLPAFDIMELSKFSLGGDKIGGVRPVVEAMIKMALLRGASDIHIEPTKEGFLSIRYRIDGILQHDSKIDEILEASREPKLHSKLVSVIKVISGESGKNMRLDVTDKPQDGRIYIPEIDLDLRIIILPSFLGESVVIRVLRREMGEFTLDQLGFEPDTFRRFKEIIQVPYGMILVAGPTGSGKSTTQYAVLKIINDPGKKVLTIEDPVEYTIPGTIQNQTNPPAGFTFEVALRAFVRSDPDIIMVGEIRDVPTAAMAMESALTGHLVISSIHARDAITTVVRLRDMGVDTRLVTATCNATLGQRLVRRNCNVCKQPYEFSSKLIQSMGQFNIEPDPNNMFKGVGCSHCYYTGYQGRIGLYELLEMTRDIKELFLEEAPTELIRETARAQQGMHTLMEDALMKVNRGVTTEEEVWRVTLLETDASLPKIEL